MNMKILEYLNGKRIIKTGEIIMYNEDIFRLDIIFGNLALHFFIRIIRGNKNRPINKTKNINDDTLEMTIVGIPCPFKGGIHMVEIGTYNTTPIYFNCEIISDNINTVKLVYQLLF